MLKFLLGAALGYVLGAKAGKERYNQIEAKFREIAGMPAVQQATATVKDTASSVADTAKTTVNDKVGGGSSSTGTSSTGTSTDTGYPPATTALDSDVVVVDLGTGANTGATAPIPGAGPSGSTL